MFTKKAKKAKRGIALLLTAIMMLSNVTEMHVHAEEEETHVHTEVESTTETSEAYQEAQATIDDILGYYLVEQGGLTLPSSEMTEEERAAFKSEIEGVVSAMDSDTIWMAQVELQDFSAEVEATLTEAEAEALLEANPVFEDFAEVVNAEEAGANLLATDATDTVNIAGLTVNYECYQNNTTIGTDGKASCTPAEGSVSASGSSSEKLFGRITASTVTITMTNTGYDNAVLTFTYTAPGSGGEFVKKSL